MNIFAGLVGTAIFYKQDQKWHFGTLTHDPNMVDISVSYINVNMNVSKEDIRTMQIKDDDAVIAKCLEELNGTKKEESSESTGCSK